MCADLKFLLFVLLFGCWVGAIFHNIHTAEEVEVFAKSRGCRVIASPDYRENEREVVCGGTKWDYYDYIEKFYPN